MEELRQPDDWHLHLRDGDLLAAVVPHSAAHFGRAIAMPNLKPPITTAAAVAYRESILKALSPGSAFEPLRTLYLTDSTSPDEIKIANLVAAVSGALALRVDLLTGDGFDAVSHVFGQPDVVINCAAISAPRACETDPEAAMGTNVPSSLVNWLARLDRGGGGEPLLIHLSTDQVYEGVKSFYKEVDETVPVNMYGKSKVAAEQFISSKCSNYAILRSSIIYGPQTISPVSKSLPIQWIDNVLSQGREVEFFHDEFRCPVYVQDVVNVILALIEKWVSDAKQMQLLLNLGGPDRVSRVQMAESVAAARGYSNSLIRAVSASSVNRGVVSPSDISMDISRLIQVLGITPVSFQAGVRSTLQSTD